MENSNDIELKDLNDDKGSSNTSIPQIDWTPDHENILVEWADKAMCYRWLHAKSHSHYSKANAWFTIPVIIMSTLTGTANFAQDRFSENIKPLVAMGIGGVNIFAGILTTIQQFLKIGELNEAHRVSSISWDKFYRNIKVELAKSPEERIHVIQMLKIAKEEFDRLMETSPSVSDKVTAEFTRVFSGGIVKSKNGVTLPLNERQEAFKALKKPEICDTLESTRFSVYKPKLAEKTSAATHSAISQAKKPVENKKKQLQIETFITAFEKEKGRNPTTTEICDELNNDVAIEYIEKLMKKNDSNEIISASAEIGNDENV